MQWIEAAEIKCTPALFLCNGVCFDIWPATTERGYYTTWELCVCRAKVWMRLL